MMASLMPGLLFYSDVLLALLAAIVLGEVTRRIVR
mgnify:CR=1 FL=1|jgi:asparagine N-glycosylation enzyme membrane subunit Stt3